MSIFVNFRAISQCVCERKNYLCPYFTYGKLEKITLKTCKKWKIRQFSKRSKIVGSTPNHVLNSGKNSYRVYEPESKD